MLTASVVHLGAGITSGGFTVTRNGVTSRYTPTGAPRDFWITQEVNRMAMQTQRAAGERARAAEAARIQTTTRTRTPTPFWPTPLPLVRTTTPTPTQTQTTTTSRLDRYNAYARVTPSKTAAQIQEEGRISLQMREAAARAAMARTAAARRAEQAVRELRQQRIDVYKAPERRAGVRAWTEYYQNVLRQPIPAGIRETAAIYDKAALYEQTAGKRYVQKQEIGGRAIVTYLGIAWMFRAAYGGDMPYWDAWYNKTMTAREIGERVAADYLREINRRVLVQNQNIQIRPPQALGPPPTVTLPPSLVTTQPPPIRRAIPAPPSLVTTQPPPIQRSTALPPIRLPAAPGISADLPPLIFQGMRYIL